MRAVRTIVAATRRLLLTSLILLPLTTSAASTPFVEVEPRGMVKAIRQVTARFSEAMVPFGDLRDRQPPFVVDCEKPAQARWLDARTWVLDFESELPAGVSCRLTLQAGLRTLAGRAFPRADSFAFSTGGPAIVNSSPSSGDESIDEEQAFILVLDGEPDHPSIVEHAYFTAAGITERIGLRILVDHDRESIAKTVWRGLLSGPWIAVQPLRRLPHQAEVELVWGAGIRTISGVPTENEQRLKFKTRGPFEARMRCQRENARADCVPLADVILDFSAPVDRDLADRVLLRAADGRTWTPVAGESGPEPAVTQVRFAAPFPELTTLHLELPGDLRDDAGRALLNADNFPLPVKIAAYPPLAKFAARFGIVEATAAPALPVTVRNLEPEIDARLLRLGLRPNTTTPVSAQTARLGASQLGEVLPWLRAVARAPRTKSLFAKPPTPIARTSQVTLPKPNGADAFEVIGIPFERPGLYVVELSSTRLGRALLGAEQKMYVQAAALVTNLAVHFKQGRENALAWVTTLDSAQPVGGATVQVRDCRGELRWEGSTDASGIAWIDGLPPRGNLPSCWDAWPRLGKEPENEQREYVAALNDLDSGLLIFATSGDDFSFVHSEWQEGIEPWRFQLPPDRWSGPALRHTILDRPLFRVGETVHMKHVIRLQTLSGYAFPAEAALPAKVTVRHLGSNDTYDLPVEWRANGTAESTWTIPPGARLGRYSVQIPDPTGQAWADASAQFQVQEFRVPLMKATVGLPAGPLIAPEQVPVDLLLQYLSGGGARGAAVTLRTQTSAGRFAPPEAYEHFSFGNGQVAIATHRRGTDQESSNAVDTRVLQQEQLTLDSLGAARTTVRQLPAADSLRQLTVEMEFRDPNGEAQTARSSVSLWPAAYIVGIQAEQWISSPRSVRARLVVLKPDGSVAPDVEVRVNVRRRAYYSVRKRLVGGFYAYEDVTEVSAHGELCSGRTDPRGELECAGDVAVDGNLILQAEVADSSGRISSAHDEIWVSDRDEWRFAGSQSDRIDLIPERRNYEPGETARLQVRMPFRSATTLVTVEREGIAAAWVSALDNRNPVISVPIDRTYAPNVFISTLAVRGRSGEVQPTSQVDLGRPSFKLGIAELRVAHRAQELKVAVETDQSVYRVRQQATAEIQVRSADGSLLAPDAEVAVAAVDEGLLELLPNPSWNLLEVMTGRRGYGVYTATAQMQVIGKRHYGLKALPQGGGGGRQGTRELFDTLLLWKASVPLDSNGRATVTIPLNDSLTSFRIVAVATAGAGHFGSGSATIRSTQELMLLSGLPRVARHGDSLPIDLTVRNAGDRAVVAKVHGTVAPHGIGLAAQEVSLEPGEGKRVSWPFTVPDDGSALTYSFWADAGNGGSDSLEVTQRLAPAVPLRALQATLLRLDRPQSLPVQVPTDALPGRGGISVTMSPQLAGALSGVRDAMRAYPYECLEQRVSRAVALHDDRQWQAIVAELPSYTDSDGLLKHFPGLASGSDTLTSYVLSISHAAGWSLPATLRQQIERGLRGFVEGSVERRSAIPSSDLPLRKLAALAALARTGAATPALLSSVPTDPQLWPLSALVDWWSILDALKNLPKRSEQLRLAEQVVRQRLDWQGSVIAIAESKHEDLWWLMSNGDVSAARLLLHIADTKRWPDDVGRLARGVLARQQRGQWSTTVANAWATVAFDHFSRQYEALPVGGTTAVRLDAQAQRIDWSASPEGSSVLLPWPPDVSSLQLVHDGTGAPWATVLSQAAIPLREPLSSGYRMERTVTPVEVREPGVLHSGDVVRVRLQIEARSDMTWVVVDDPIPTGAAHLAAGYGRESAVLAAGSTPAAGLEPSFVERGERAYRAYFEVMPRGSVFLEYSLRLNQAGRLVMPPTRVEALYAPEMFAELPNSPLIVEP